MEWAANVDSATLLAIKVKHMKILVERFAGLTIFSFLFSIYW